MWIFVADQLDTHRSATLVELVANHCGINEPLGVKGKHGILKSKRSRRAFLQDPTHRIRFVYTPRHCSWLNQVEIWISILALLAAALDLGAGGDTNGPLAVAVIGGMVSSTLLTLLAGPGGVFAGRPRSPTRRFDAAERARVFPTTGWPLPWTWQDTIVGMPFPPSGGL